MEVNETYLANNRNAPRQAQRAPRRIIDRKEIIVAPLTFASEENDSAPHDGARLRLFVQWVAQVEQSKPISYCGVAN